MCLQSNWIPFVTISLLQMSWLTLSQGEQYILKLKRGISHRFSLWISSLRPLDSNKLSCFKILKKGHYRNEFILHSTFLLIVTKVLIFQLLKCLSEITWLCMETIIQYKKTRVKLIKNSTPIPKGCVLSFCLLLLFLRGRVCNERPSF